jgi:hypothetical protein
MSTLVEIAEGWTDELGPFTLEADGSPVDLTGLTVSLVLRGRDGTLVTTTDDTRIDDDPTSGKVYYTPDATDLSAAQSPYTLRWQVTDGDGIVFFPNGRADALVVYRA